MAAGTVGARRTGGGTDSIVAEANGTSKTIIRVNTLTVEAILWAFVAFIIQGIIALTGITGEQARGVLIEVVATHTRPTAINSGAQEAWAGTVYAPVNRGIGSEGRG